MFRYADRRPDELPAGVSGVHDVLLFIRRGAWAALMGRSSHRRFVGQLSEQNSWSTGRITLAGWWFARAAEGTAMVTVVAGDAGRWAAADWFSGRNGGCWWDVIDVGRGDGGVSVVHPGDGQPQ